MPSSRRLADDLDLVGADQGAKHRALDHRVGASDVVERLGRNLAEALARDEGARLLATRDLLGDPEHQTPVEDDAQLGRSRKRDLALAVAERDSVDARDATGPLEHMGDVIDQPFARIGGLGPAGKVDADDDRAAARHAP